MLGLVVLPVIYLMATAIFIACTLEILRLAILDDEAALFSDKAMQFRNSFFCTADYKYHT